MRETLAPAKPLFCAHCYNEIVGDAWYMGRYISYTHKANGRFMCEPLNWSNNEHAEPVVPA